MTRIALTAGLLAFVACSGDDDGLDLDYTTVVADDAGRPFNAALSPDGTQLAYAMPVDGAAAIFVASADGNDPVRLTHGVWDQNPVWSPDGRWIAYHGEAPDYDVFVVETDGGEPRQLTSGPAIDLPAEWLPDGSAVVFYRTGEGAAQTLIVGLDGGATRPLVPPMEGNQWVTVAPDGSRAAFDLHRGGEGTIWVQGLAGGVARQLTTEGLENAPTRNMWSPDGRFLAYVSRRTGTWDIWIAEVETGGLRKLTSDIRNDRSFRWSPDGRWIAFLSDRGGQDDVWIIPAAGGEAVRVTQDLASEADLHWSRDGQTLYYLRIELEDQLHVISSDGATSRVLAGWTGYGINYGVISPDGHTVLFASDRSGNADIWSVPFDGGEPTPFVAGPLTDQRPRFSPDGSQVLFSSDRGGSWDVWLVPAAGGDPRQITDWPSFDGTAEWSPDGMMIAFLSNRDATQNEVWVMAVDGAEPRRLTHTTAAAGGIAWSPDGQSVYYIGATPGGTRDLYRVSVIGGEPEALGANPNIGNGDLSPDGMQYAYAVFEGGWGFIEVLPTAGGPPRRMTPRTERVFQNSVDWSPDGTRLFVTDYDFPTDSYDLHVVSWPEGDWQPLTRTTEANEFAEDFTPDGGHVLLSFSMDSRRIMSVSVAELVDGEQ